MLEMKAHDIFLPLSASWKTDKNITLNTAQYMSQIIFYISYLTVTLNHAN